MPQGWQRLCGGGYRQLSSLKQAALVGGSARDYPLLFPIHLAELGGWEKATGSRARRVVFRTLFATLARQTMACCFSILIILRNGDLR